MRLYAVIYTDSSSSSSDGDNQGFAAEGEANTYAARFARQRLRELGEDPVSDDVPDDIAIDMLQRVDDASLEFEEIEVPDDVVRQLYAQLTDK